MIPLNFKTLKYGMGYPVGLEIKTNKNHILEMVKAFNSVDEFKHKFVNIICRGSSGAIIAGIFSYLIENENHITHIKKEGENSHSSGFSLSKGDKSINIIVDDFVATGSTVNAIYSKLTERSNNVKIDCLLVTATVELNRLNFKPEYIISGRTKKWWDVEKRLGIVKTLND